MYKEIIICIIIIFTILLLNTVTKNYTEKSVGELIGKIEETKENMINEKEFIEYEDLKKNMDYIYEIWEKRQKILALYIEHNELEKVETNFVICKSFISQSDYEMSINSIDKTIYSLNHLTDKYAFNIINIF